MRRLGHFALDIAIALMVGLNWLLEWPQKWSNNYEKRAILDKQLNGLTNHGFLDRATKEKE